MQRFHLERTEDVSGSSGTGAVAEGVVFGDGTVAMRWRMSPGSTATYDCLGDVAGIRAARGSWCPIKRTHECDFNKGICKAT